MGYHQGWNGWRKAANKIGGWEGSSTRSTETGASNSQPGQGGNIPQRGVGSMTAKPTSSLPLVIPPGPPESRPHFVFLYWFFFFLIFLFHGKTLWCRRTRSERVPHHHTIPQAILHFLAFLFFFGFYEYPDMGWWEGEG